MVLVTRLRAERQPLLPAAEGEPLALAWQQDERGYYHRLLRFRPLQAGLFGQGGVYLLWHRGVRPRWICAGAADDLGRALDRARDHDGVLAYEPFGGVYLSWAAAAPEQRAGIARYLRDSLGPELELRLPGALRPVADTAPIPVLPPS